MGEQDIVLTKNSKIIQHYGMEECVTEPLEVPDIDNRFAKFRCVEQTDGEYVVEQAVFSKSPCVEDSMVGDWHAFVPTQKNEKHSLTMSCVHEAEHGEVSEELFVKAVQTHEIEIFPCSH